MNRIIILVATAFGFSGVVLGAFGAHALENVLTTDQLSTYDTGIRYHLIHAVLLLFLGVENRLKPKRKKLILYFIALGVILFSGSIYGLACNDVINFDFTQIALLTPLGGSLLILSWLLIFISYWPNNHKSNQFTRH